MTAPIRSLPPLAGDVGQPLDGGICRRLERTFGADLSAVRIHTDPVAGQAAAALRARAFTYGHDIYFGTGTFDPDTAAGLWLLSHEVAHALQQSQAPGDPRAATHMLSTSNDPWEREADQCAAMVLAGTRLPYTPHNAL